MTKPAFFTSTELQMWNDDPFLISSSHTDISRRYAQGEGRIVVETNRERLPQFVHSLAERKVMDLKPFYQRRSRWKVEKQSLLIESFIMNIPVPPVFLYEKDYGQYEVMDGQQRLTALRDFYKDKFALKGLITWSEINGYFYSNLPDSIKSALDRRSISSIVVLKESTSSEKEANFIREAVFERLNTGGIELTAQEIRNALYQSKFNEMITGAANWNLFRAIWNIPIGSQASSEHEAKLNKNPIYNKMEDIELVLRFFALRHVKEYSGGMRGFLDAYIRNAVNFNDQEIYHLNGHFRETLATVYEIFGSLSFCPYLPKKGEWSKRPQKAFYDAVMQSIALRLDNRDEMIAKSSRIIQSTMLAFENYEPGAFTGRGNSKSDIIRRIELFGEVVDSAL